MLAVAWFALFQLRHDLSGRGIACVSGSPLVIETQVLKGIGKSRELVLWMCDAEKHDADIDPEAYTCPDETTGHFYRGRTSVSLVDAVTKNVINTVPVTASWPNDGTFDIPYKIAGFFYHVAGPLNKYHEGKPTIMWLKDYNGDGEATEFALFEASNCTIVETTLFGYSRPQDRVIQYPIHLLQREGSITKPRDRPWVDHLFINKPESPGHWKWQYQYHVGGLTHFDIRYVPAKEEFEGEIVIDPEPL
ncbi:MAG TPA: hypothetical protein VKU01_25625 [Bryobacteraceae bacterium]|nr:hypothetical protein [Bryobacteraceae bacterium]